MDIGIIASDADNTYYEKSVTLLGHKPVLIKKSLLLDTIKGLIISGKEGDLKNSLLSQVEVRAKVRQKALSGMAVLGVAGGVKIIASSHKSDKIPEALDLIDITVSSAPAALLSFNTEINIPALGNEPVQAQFLQSPIILECQPNVGILAVLDERIVLARQGDFLACTFYPFSNKDFRILEYFIGMVQETQT